MGLINSDVSHKIRLLSLIAAMLVVCIHLPMSNRPGVPMFIELFIGSKVALVAVPFFFTISGYLLANSMQSHGWTIQLKKRLTSVLLPYVLWCIFFSVQAMVTMALSNLINHYPITRQVDFNLIDLLGLDITKNPPTPLWYLRALMIYILLSPIFFAMIKKKHIWLIVASALIVLECAKSLWLKSNVAEMFAFTFSPRNVLAFCTGIWLFDHPIALKSGVGWLLIFLGAMGFCLLTSQCVFGFVIPNVASAGLTNLSILCFLVGVWVVCPPIELPLWLQGQAFPIYLLHCALIPYVIPFTRVFLSASGLIGYMVNVIVLIMGSVTINLALRKFAPRFSNVVFGGR